MRMNYNYTAYYENEEERIRAITEDILREYPRLGSLAEVAARLETPFGRVHEDYDQFSNQENHVNRLIDIVIVTEGKPEYKAEYEKACRDLEEYYLSWQRNFTYANPQEQEVYVLMQRYYEHQKDKTKPLMTYEDANKTIRAKLDELERQRQWTYDHTMRYEYTEYYEDNNERIKAIVEDILREYPRLGSLAEEAAKMEKPFGRVHEDYDQFSDQENHVNRLIDIVIVTEGKPEFKAEYDKACRDLEEYYLSWQRGFTYANPQEQAVYIVMQRYYEHQKDKSKPLMTIKEADRIIRFQLEAEDRQRKWKFDHTMRYDFTAYYDNEEDRIRAITEDILREYPNLEMLAEVAARLETPFGRVHEDYDQFSSQENHINRLIDIIIVTEGKPKYQREYDKACRDLVTYYRSWENAFTYANPQEQAVYLIMEQFNAHLKDKRVPLYTFKEAQDIQRQRQVEIERNRKADMLRHQYPKLGDLATEVIRMEEESGIWVKFDEREIIRLVYIIKLAEENEDYEDVYSESIAQVRQLYQNYMQYGQPYMDEEKEAVIEMMSRLETHLTNGSVPIITFEEARQEVLNRRNRNKNPDDDFLGM